MKKILSFLLASQSLGLSLLPPNHAQEIDSNLIAFGYGTVKRVYCSNKSLGFDLHFNNKTGQLYSFDEFTNKLVPFSIESEIPFASYFPSSSIEDFLYEWKEYQVRIDSGINNEILSIKISSGMDPYSYFVATLNLSSLLVGVNLYGPEFYSEQRKIATQVARQIKCEYIQPESFSF